MADGFGLGSGASRPGALPGVSPDGLRETGSRPLRDSEADSPSGAAPQSLELRHLRYFVVVADAGTFTHAAGRLFIAQPTLSQQIQRLEQIVGTPLLRRQRDGVRLTAAGTVLLDASRDVLSVADHAVSQTQQAAGLGRLRLRFVLSADLPDSLAVTTNSRMRSAAEAAGAALTWLETTLDADFSSIRQRRADAGLGWLPATPRRAARPARRHEPGRVRACLADGGQGRPRDARWLCALARTSG